MRASQYEKVLGANDLLLYSLCRRYTKYDLSHFKDSWYSLACDRNRYNEDIDLFLTIAMYDSIKIFLTNHKRNPATYFNKIINKNFKYNFENKNLNKIVSQAYVNLITTKKYIESLLNQSSFYNVNIHIKKSIEEETYYLLINAIILKRNKYFLITFAQANHNEGHVKVNSNMETMFALEYLNNHGIPCENVISIPLIHNKEFFQNHASTCVITKETATLNIDRYMKWFRHVKNDSFNVSRCRGCFKLEKCLSKKDFKKGKE